MKVTQRWKQTSLANKMLVVTSSFMAFGTVFYAGAAIFQIHILRQSAQQTSQQTEKLITASERLANSANAAVEDARNASREMADRAERITRANETFATTSETSAKAAQASAAAAQKSVVATKEATITGNRAYVRIESSSLDMATNSKQIVLIVVWANDGNSSARLTGTVRIKLGPNVSTGCDYNESPNVQNLMVGPKSKRTQRFVVDRPPNLHTEPGAPDRQFVMFCGQVFYETLEKTYKYQFCGWYSDELKQFADCEGAKNPM
jgi:hypothetical protein